MRTYLLDDILLLVEQENQQLMIDLTNDFFCKLNLNVNKWKSAKMKFDSRKKNHKFMIMKVINNDNNGNKVIETSQSYRFYWEIKTANRNMEAHIKEKER